MKYSVNPFKNGSGGGGGDFPSLRKEGLFEKFVEE